MRALVSLSMLWLLVGCETETPTEKIESGTTRIAIGAPMTVGGSIIAVGTAVGGLVAATNRDIPSAEAPAVNGALVGSAVVAAANLGVGIFLLVTGEGMLDDGLAWVQFRTQPREKPKAEASPSRTHVISRDPNEARVGDDGF